MAVLKITPSDCKSCLENRKLRVCIGGTPGSSASCKVITFCRDGKPKTIKMDFWGRGQIRIYELDNSDEPVYSSPWTVSAVISVNETSDCFHSNPDLPPCKLCVSYSVNTGNLIALTRSFILLAAELIISFLASLPIAFLSFFRRPEAIDSEILDEDDEQSITDSVTKD